jgi:ribosomal protein S14
MFALYQGRGSAREVEQVPVSQAIEVMPEINSGENNPVAVKESLAPEMFMGRAVTRCRHCHLNQFMTASGMCRKCRQSLAPEPVPDPIPDVQPVATVNNGYGRPSRAPIAGAALDMGFAIKLIRLANGMSQRDLSKRGFLRTYISKVENGACIPTVPLVEKFAAALDITPYALITIAEAACAA